MPAIRFRPAPKRARAASLKSFPVAPLFVLLLLTASALDAAAREQVLYSPSGTYAFPVAGAIDDMAWTHFHWNGGNAVDVVPAPGLSPDSRAFRSFEHAPIVAVVGGTVRPADNEFGGTALLLFGDDGREYYYAHLSSTGITRPTTVTAGEQIGVIGRTGRWAKYIEIHLHFAISSKWHKGLNWPNDVNAAEWFRSTFGLRWVDQNPHPYPAAFPDGSPLAEPYRIVESFEDTRAANPDAASIRMAPAGGSLLPVPVYSTLLGEVRVMRATVFGLRIQVTNRHTKQTVVYSGLSSASLVTGSVAGPGQIVGWASGPIDYMYFNRGVLADPTPMLAAGVDRLPAEAPPAFSSQGGENAATDGGSDGTATPKGSPAGESGVNLLN